MQGIVLEGDRTYLVSCPIFGAVGIRFHSGLRCMICLDCQWVVLPADLPGHMIKQHNMDKLNAKELSTNVAMYEPFRTREEVCDPAPGGPPVEGLAVHLDGFSCGECDYAAKALNTIQRHMREEHSNSSNFLKGVAVQTCLKGVGCRYFVVNPTLKGVPACDPLTAVVRDYLPRLVLPAPGPPETTREIDPLLRVTHWHDHLKPWLTNKTKLEELLTFSAIRKDSGGYTRIADLCLEYLKKCRSAGDGLGYLARGFLFPG